MKKVLFFLGICFSFSFNVLANEAILGFNSLIEVQRDGSVLVTENLTVRHEGKQIRRGIYRDLPLTKGVSYEPLSVTRDGRAEPFFIERKGTYFRINTGNDDFLPNPGISEFSIQYRVLNALKSYQSYDEIYWNVTGDQWAFPIMSARAQVVLPPGAEIIQQAGYVGRSGSRIAPKISTNGYFETDVLNPGQQLTVAVGFTPGIVEIPLFKDRWLKVIFALLGLFGYYLAAWYFWGRDPQARAIMPLFHPPEGISASEAGYIYNYGKVPANLFAVFLIEMFTRGFLKVEEVNEKGLLFTVKKYQVTLTGKKALTPEEVLFEQSFPNGVVLDSTYNSALEKYFKKNKKDLEKGMKSYYKQRNGVTVGGLFLFSALFLFLYPELFYDENSYLIALLCVFGFFDGWTILFAGFVLAFAILGELELSTFVYLVGGSFLTFLFSRLMFQPSEKGKRIIEHLKGNAMFLKATKRPLSKEEQEKIMPETMEELFPYALALGLRKEWERQFKRYFNVSPELYYGSSHLYYHSSFERCISSSSGCSSGSGGGGSAGGGCGGGGGGGR